MADRIAGIMARQSQGGDKNIGSADKMQSSSASQVVSTLVPVLLVFLVYIAIFLVLRRVFARIYQPRTFVGSVRAVVRRPAMSKSLFGWVKEFMAVPDTFILNHHSLDGFLFLRFLKISVISCVVGCIITWPVLFPVHATGGGGLTQLDLLTMANIKNKWRFWADAGCAIIFFSYILFMITRESIYYINIRQAYLLSPLYAARLSSRTVLFCSVPEDFMHEGKLRAMLGEGVRRVWFARDCSDLQDKVDQRDNAAMKLEGAETKLIRTANAKRLEAEKKGNAGPSEEAGEASRWLDQKDRPTHKLGKFGLYGKKVDSIDWARNELKTLIPEVDKMQAEEKAGNCKMLNSVFVEFETLSQAQSAYQSLTHHQPLKMAPRFTGMTPTEVIWGNLGIQWHSRVVRGFATTGIVVALIIFWSIPVAFVGAISNVNYLIKVIPAFKFINDIPKVVLGVVTGLLPVVLLAVLMALLPIFLRWMAKKSGDPTLSAVELTTQNYYFGFQVVQVFLVATIGSAASSAVGEIIKDPSTVATLLSNDLPKASNFYLCYFILQGLGFAGGALALVVGLALFFVLGKLLDKTPRKMYKRWYNLSNLGFGTVFPVYTNLFVIAICYSAIAPLVLGFAAIGMYLFYFAYRYNLLFVGNQNIDTKGRIYPRALQQLFVGLYLAEVCLIGLFGIGVGSSNGAIGPLILMILFLIFTALYQISLNSALGPMINYLPKSMDAEERRLLAAERDEEIGESMNGNGKEKDAGASVVNTTPHKKPNFLTKFLKPHIYNDYATMRRLVPKELAIGYDPIVEEEAYFNPAITERMPLLWIPRDQMGISRKEIADTSQITPMTDEGASLDEKNKIVWGGNDSHPPIYQEKIDY